MCIISLLLVRKEVFFNSLVVVVLPLSWVFSPPYLFITKCCLCFVYLLFLQVNQVPLLRRSPRSFSWSPVITKSKIHLLCISFYIYIYIYYIYIYIYVFITDLCTLMFWPLKLNVYCAMCVAQHALDYQSK